MPLRIHNGDSILALPINQLLRLGQGYETITGCASVLEINETEIQVSVSEGAIRHDGDSVSVTSQTVTLQPGDPQYNRRDVLWIDRHGDVRVFAGEARELAPSDADSKQAWSPAPIDASGLDGVPICEVWIPPNTEGSSELNNEEHIFDRRVGGSVYSAVIPERPDNPPRDELRLSRMWINTSAADGEGLLMYYNSHADEIRRLEPIDDTTGEPDEEPEETFPDPAEIIIEEFTRSSIEGNWIGGTSFWEHKAPSVVGDVAAYSVADSHITHKYSMPGDGLNRYPDIGYTIRLWVTKESETDPAWVNLGFGKATDTRAEDYRVELNWRREELELYRVNETIPDHTSLSTIDNFSLSSDEWYVIEVEYDGGGQGVHPFRLYSTDASNEIDSVLDEETSPPSDTTYRGRGVALRTSTPGTGLDKLQVVEPDD